MKYYFMAFKNYAKCDGRATRKEYWWFMLFHYIVMFALAFLDGVFGFYSKDIPLDYGYMTLIYMFASACPSLCLQVRRLHDVGKSGSWWWLKRVPIVSLYVFYLNCKASEPTINAYGTPFNYETTTGYDWDKLEDDLNQTRFCPKCGFKQISGSRFCGNCGIEVIEINRNNKVEFPVCIFDMNTHTLRKENREIDTKKFPPAQYSKDNTYYAIETIKNGKKVRVYHTKDSWSKQIEKGI